MSSETGKHIFELDSLNETIDSGSYLIISQDNLARKITIDKLKESFNGDNKDVSENTYYSSKYISDLINTINGEILNTKQDIINSNNDINTKIDSIKYDINQNNRTIYNEVYNMIKDSIKTVNERIDDEISTINENIENVTNNITNIQAKLQGITKIEIGTEVPTELSEGTIYLQYF